VALAILGHDSALPVCVRIPPNVFLAQLDTLARHEGAYQDVNAGMAQAFQINRRTLRGKAMIAFKIVDPNLKDNPVVEAWLAACAKRVNEKTDERLFDLSVFGVHIVEVGK
jgi:hypothetical protein